MKTMEAGIQSMQLVERHLFMPFFFIAFSAASIEVCEPSIATRILENCPLILLANIAYSYSALLTVGKMLDNR